MKNLRKAVIATVIGGGAALGMTLGMGAGTASADIDNGQYNLTNPTGKSHWSVNGNTLHQHPVPGAVSPNGNFYHIKDTARGGYVDTSPGTRATFRENGHGGYHGNFYIGGLRVAPIHLSPR